MNCKLVLIYIFKNEIFILEPAVRTVKGFCIYPKVGNADWQLLSLTKLT